MRNKRIFGLVLAFLYPVFAIGQNVSIVGKTNIPNALVRLLAYDEMLTCEQTKIAETQADKDGKFVLEADLKEVTPAQIAINLERIDIILNPGGQYDFEIIIPENSEGSYFEREQPLIKVNSAQDDGFYMQYIETQSIINNFTYEYFERIYRGGDLSLLEILDSQLVESVGKIKNEYIKNYIKYRKATLVMTVNTPKTIKEFFDNQKVLYSLAAYMELLAELSNDIGRNNDFLSHNWQIAEIVRMMNLKKSFYANPQSKNQVLEALEKINKSSKSKKNQLIAKNIMKQVSDLSYDSDAPAFSLKDKDGKTIQLSDYQNDMVLLQFVDRITPLTEKEFASLNDLHKQWNDTIQIVTIATKESFEGYSQLFEKQRFNWPLLNLGDNILLLEDYHVKMYPAYIILKRKNRIGMAPAPSPFHYLDKEVRRISKYL